MNRLDLIIDNMFKYCKLQYNCATCQYLGMCEQMGDIEDIEDYKHSVKEVKKILLEEIEVDDEQK